MRRSSLRLAVLGLTGAVAGAAILLGVEVAVVLRRDFLVDVPWDPIHAGLGDVGASELGLVVIGDSTAVGVGTRAEEEAYPTLLARRLAEAGFRVRLDVVAASGARVAAAADLQTPRALSLRPDIVLVVIGANDVTHLDRKSVV